MAMTKQEQRVTLEALARERTSEQTVLARLKEREEKASERGDEPEVLRVQNEHEHHTEILKAVERELSSLGAKAETKASRAAKRA